MRAGQTLCKEPKMEYPAADRGKIAHAAGRVQQPEASRECLQARVLLRLGRLEFQLANILAFAILTLDSMALLKCEGHRR